MRLQFISFILLTVTVYCDFAAAYACIINHDDQLERATSATILVPQHWHMYLLETALAIVEPLRAAKACVAMHMHQAMISYSTHTAG